jgi:hypothetical protein
LLRPASGDGRGNLADMLVSILDKQSITLLNAGGDRLPPTISSRFRKRPIGPAPMIATS